jgi:hypothetical protein
MQVGELISKEIEEPLELPAVGFDEWYVFDESPNVVPTQNHVNHYDFSLLDESDVTRSFWKQIKETTPLHVLKGRSSLFFVTRDRAIFDLVKNIITDNRPSSASSNGMDSSSPIGV